MSAVDNKRPSFSPISATTSFSPPQSSTDHKVVSVVKNMRYESPPPNFTSKPPEDANKPSPADSIKSLGSNCSSLCDGLGDLTTLDRLRFKELSDLDRPATVNVPKFGEKRTAGSSKELNTFFEDLEEEPSKRKKFTVARRPTYESLSYELQGPPLSSIPITSGAHSRDDRYDPMFDRGTKLQRK